LKTFNQPEVVYVGKSPSKLLIRGVHSDVTNYVTAGFLWISQHDVYARLLPGDAESAESEMQDSKLHASL